MRYPWLNSGPCDSSACHQSTGDGGLVSVVLLGEPPALTHERYRPGSR